MADVFTKEQRSQVMSRVRNQDTTPELALRKAMWTIGLRGWRCNRRDLPGTPDVSFGRAKVAVFVDGAFWHGHPSKFKAGQSGDFWDRKIQDNVARDRAVDQQLRDMGWEVIRVWDFQITADPLATARQVQMLREQRSSTN